MKFFISGKNIDIGDNLRLYAQDKLTNISKHYSVEFFEVHATFSKEKYLFHCNLLIHLNQEFIARSDGEEHDAYKSLDIAVSKIDQMINKYKSKLKNRHRREYNYEVKQENLINLSVEIKNNEKDNLNYPLIISESIKDLLILSINEAIMKMDSSNKSLIIFKNANSGSVNLLYKRDDGNVGWIDLNI